MTEQEVVQLLQRGTRIRYVPHRFAKTGSTDDPRILVIGDKPQWFKGWDASGVEQLLIRMEREGQLESHDDLDNNISEYVLPGESAAWEKETRV